MSALDKIIADYKFSFSELPMQDAYGLYKDVEEAIDELVKFRTDSERLDKENKSLRHILSLWKKTEAMKAIEILQADNSRLQKAVDTARYILIDVDTYEDKNSPVIEDEVKAWLDSNKETK